MLEQLKQMLREIEKDDEIFELNAKLLKKAHVALIKNGFTEEQATIIVASQGSGLKSS